ncbi:MAG: hypothetical protein ACRDYA_14535 [Egibacteraceae bacterium]
MSAVITLLTAILPLQERASPEALFVFMLWLLVMVSLLFVGFVVWTFFDGYNVEREALVQKLQRERAAIAYLYDLEAHVPQMIRFRQRDDTFTINERGDAILRMEGDVESPRNDHVPWVALAILAEVAEDRPEWSSIEVTRLVVGSKDEDPSVAFKRRDRRRYYDDSYHASRIVESGVIWIPVGLRPGQSRCTFSVTINIIASTSTMSEMEFWYVDVSYVTEELNVTLGGSPGYRVTSAPHINYKVEAMQLGMELIDVPESELQSSNCITADSVRWRTRTAKLGYRYRVALRGYSEHASSHPSA